MQSGLALVAAYAVFTWLNVTASAGPAWVSSGLRVVAAAWFAAAIASDARRWTHYDTAQRTRTVVVWAAVLLVALTL